MKDGMPLGDALRSAWSPADGHPSPETFLSWEMEELPPEERRRLEEHLARCPACAAERDLARLFEEEGAGEDVDFVVSRLEGMHFGGKAGGTTGRKTEEARVLPIAPAPAARREVRAAEAPRRSRRSPLWGLAAAAMLAMTCGILFQMRQTPPALPDPGSAGVFRGADLAPVSPVGELEEAPSELLWEEAPGARRYRWRVISVDGAVLGEGTVSNSPAPLPEVLVRSLKPAVVYTWTVEALDNQGGRLALSEPVRFRVRPPVEGDPPLSRDGG
jgi:hypothetical protein